MKHAFLILALALSPIAHAADGWSGNVNFLLGSKNLEENDWAPVEHQGEFGVMVDFKGASWPFSIAIDMLGSGTDETVGGIYYEGKTSELDLGVRKIFEFENSKIRPFIGGGLALIGAEQTVGIGALAISESDSSAGIWLNGGVYWVLSDSFNLGFQIRASGAEVTLFGNERKAGGGHSGLMLGVHW